jgi:hypothetical protein
MALWPIFCPAAAGLAPHVRISVCSSLGVLKIGQIADGGIPPTYETVH